MSVPICSLPDCDVIASGRCPDCEDVFCLKHMSSTPPLICDGCRKVRAEHAAEAARAREQAARARESKEIRSCAILVVICGIVGAIAGWGLAPLLHLGTSVQGGVMGAVIGAVFTFFGGCVFKNG